MKHFIFFTCAFLLFACSQGNTENLDKPNNEMSESDVIDIIHSNVKQFSEHVMSGDYKAVGEMYTKDAKIFPSDLDIIKGREAVMNYWNNPSGYTVSYHKVTPEEIKVWGDEAYDYGYYEGKSKDPEGVETSWKGKYVIIWKKEDSDWKIHLDIWNRIAD